MSDEDQEWSNANDQALMAKEEPIKKEVMTANTW
jgi:hypothetical protein